MLTLFLMTEKGYDFLRGTLDDYRSLFRLVVVGFDTSVLEDYSERIICLCEEMGVPWICREDFSGIESEYVVAVSWRWLISHPSDKLIVFHDSILPKYRGFAPLVNSLVNGEPEIGVSAILGADDFDRGDLIAQSKSLVAYPIKISDAIKVNNENYISCAHSVLGKLARGELLNAVPQDENFATYSVWRDEEDYRIEWNNSAASIRRFVDAVSFPYKGASTLLDGRVVRLLSVEEYPDVVVENRHPGKVLFAKQGKPVVICGEGMLKIIDAHYEDKDGMTQFFPMKKFRMRFS
ncbi:methionyl-tRNA formyltransferase [Paracidovorax anthurii]|uniref:Methionyl-tRNA formyltransferase n=1 Tax=Paracidovorax anthurii TaxID=78229 RepID=A0A328YSI1_9BURK|nr:formyltransferase family protein [Paracidovorax anthurii]RAR76971.1 methionyl-tRNA formyltransferase [Paracidovorax anthurii]